MSLYFLYILYFTSIEGSHVIDHGNTQTKTRANSMISQKGTDPRIISTIETSGGAHPLR